MHLLLDVLYAIAAATYLPVLLWRMAVTGKYRSGWNERFGRVPIRRGDRPCIWIHAVSLGEVNATRSLIAELSRRLPTVDIVLSTTTQTGHDAARRELAGRIASIVRFPLDFSPAVAAAFGRIRPSLVLLMELEVWPNFMRQAARTDVPVAVVNGRITQDRSMKRYRLPVVRRVARWMFSRIRWVAAQDSVYADRFRELGVSAHDVHVVGSMKYDTALTTGAVAGDQALATAMAIDLNAPLLVAGSTGPGEEQILLVALERLRRASPDVQLAIIPRKPERFDEVAQLITAAGHAVIRRSQHPDGAIAQRVSHGPLTIWLGDTMGELRKFYSLCNVAFVGRSLVPMGGSDVMEVAALGKPILMGPFRENFLDAAEQLQSAGAIADVRDSDTLAAAAARWLTDPPSATQAGAAGRRVVQANTGATQRTADLVETTLTASLSRSAMRAKRL